MREWIVMLYARSSIRLKGEGTLHITASPESTIPISAIRLRNRFTNLDGKLLVTGLITEAGGIAEDASSAVALLARCAAPYLQLMATVANGAIDDPKGLLVYAPPTADDVGRYLEQRPCDPPLPAVTIRSIGIEDLGSVVGPLLSHPDEERIHRAMAHYRQALSVLDPFNRVMSAEHLQMASENLGQVVFRRLCREAGMIVSDDRRRMGDNKHQLAIAAGFQPAGKSRQHLNDFDSYVRIEHIFNGDRELYRTLREASDAFEHGYGSFGEVQHRAHASVDQAFACVRRAILREIGVMNGSVLLGSKYEYPLAGWQPMVEASGTFTSDRHEDWPYFYGTNLFPEIIAVEDVDDDRRSVTLQVTATATSLLEGQQLSVESTGWLLPLAPERKVEIGKPEVVVTQGGEEQ